MRKTFTLLLLTALTLGTLSSACPVSLQETAVAVVNPHATTHERSPSRDSEQATLEEMRGDPESPRNRDLDRDIERTYHQRENIESDYGKELEKEIQESPDSNDIYRKNAKDARDEE